MQPLKLQVVDDSESIGCLTDPVKQDILRTLTEEGSAASVGKTLGLPRQRLAYHIRKLEQAGLLKHLRDERKGNCNERIMRATARRYLIAPNALASDLDTKDLQDRLSANALLSLAAQCIEDLAAISATPEARSKRVSTLSLDTEVGFTSQQEKADFAAALSGAIAQVAARFKPKGGHSERRFKVLLGAWPQPNIEPQESSHE